MSDDSILLSGLKVAAWIGVPAEERAEPQVLSISVEMVPARALPDLGDSLEHTVDYALVAAEVRRLAASQKRRLLETLAEDLAVALLERFPLRRVSVEVRKFVLPHCEFVAVKITRSRD